MYFVGCMTHVSTSITIRQINLENEVSGQSHSDLGEIRGRYRISRKGGRGLSRVWIFHTWTFHSGTNHVVHGQNPSRHNGCRGGQNAGHFMGQEGQNANLIKTLNMYGTNHVVHGQNPSRQNAGGQNASQNCRGRQNAGHFMAQEGKMSILSKHLMCCTYGQELKMPLAEKSL